jgi:phosphoglycolate phosphatase
MIKECSLSELVKRYDYFILDADGVIWENNTPIGDSVKGLQYLLDNKKSVFILTNNSYKSRADFIKKGKAVLGLDLPGNCWYTSSRITAVFIKEKFPEIKSVYVVGGPGIVEELSLIGITEVKGVEDSLKKYEEEKFWSKELEDVDCVIAGLDPGFNYYKLITATNCIRRGAKFIATNSDAGIKMGTYLMPGAGSLVAAIEKCSEIVPILIGKPESISLEIIMKECKIAESEKSKILIIGDRLETDIKFAKNTGISSCIVLTGVTTKEMLHGDIIPDYVMDKLGTF